MKRKILIILSIFMTIIIVGCADSGSGDSVNTGTGSGTGSMTGTGTFNDIADRFLPEGYPILNLPNEVQYTQTSINNISFLELITRISSVDISLILDALSDYYNTQFDINSTNWNAENNNHTFELTYDSGTGELIFDFTFKTNQEIPEQPAGSLNVKEYIITKPYGTLTSNPAYSLIMLSTDNQVYVKSYNLNGEVGNGTKCVWDDYDCLTTYISNINKTTGIGEDVTKIFKTNINDTIFAVTKTGNLYSWGNGNPTPTSLITLSGDIKEIMEFNNNINYLYTNTNNLYELKYIDNIWSVKEIIIPDEKIMQVDFGNIIYLLTESGKQYSYNHNTSDIKQISGIDGKIKYVFHSSTSYDDLHIVITENNNIYGWGMTYYDNILDEYKYGIDINIPKLLNWDISTNGMITQFFIRGDYVYAVTDKGLLYKFGYETGIVPNINNIKEVQLIISKPYSDSTIFLTISDGSVYTLYNDEITKMDGLKNVKKLYTIYHSSYDTNIYAITEDGDVYSYGTNYDGILGIGETNQNYTTSVATKINIPEPVKELYTHVNDRTYAIYALTSNGNVYAWGNNSGDVYKANIGILGIGNTTDKYIPVPTKVNTSNVTKITNIINDDSDEMSIAYALTADNKLYYWGYDRNSAGGWSSLLFTTPQLIEFTKQ